MESTKNFTKKERNTVYDLIRVIAIVAVVFIHCHEQMKFSMPVVGTMLYLFGRMGVPLFIMLTGALLISRGDGDVFRFYKTRLIPMYIISVFWLLFYRLVNKQELAEAVKKSFNLVSSAKHLWYLPVLIALYVAIPFLSVLKKRPKKELIWILAGIFLIAEAKTLKTITMVPGFITTIWFGYMIFGYLIHEYAKKSKLNLCVSLCGVIASATLFYQTKNFAPYKEYFSANKIDIWWYDSPFIVLTALFLFMFLTQLELPDNKTVQKICESLSKCSFGIYVIHVLVILKSAPYVKEHVSNANAATAALFILSFGASYIFSFVVGKIPCLRFLVHQKK